MSSLFCGCALCEVDADGIVRLPDFLAEALGPNDETGDLLVSPHEIDKCLVGFHRDHLDELAVRAERWRLADESAGRDARAHYARSRRCFGMVERAPRDAGAIRLPDAMRHLGQIGATALFVGAGDRFEIWNPDLAIASGDAELRELAAWRLSAYRRRRQRRPARRG
jgi:DNA-binding transcriptional regulator/RsmH inhibitor MraZ